MFNNSGGSFNLFNKGKLNDFRVWKSKRNAGNENIMNHIGRNIDRIKKSASILNGEDKDQLQGSGRGSRRQDQGQHHVRYRPVRIPLQGQPRHHHQLRRCD